MGKNKNGEQPELPLEERPNPQNFINCKQFIQKLKGELNGIPERAYKAFIAISPALDTEANYRKVWNSTFKRARS